MAFIAASEPIVGSGSCYLQWLPLLPACLKQVLTTTLAHLQWANSHVFAHNWLKPPCFLVHSCQNWRQSWGPQQASKPRQTSQIVHQWLSALKQNSISHTLPSWIQCYHTAPHLAPSTTRPRVTAWSIMSLPTSKKFPFPKSVHKVWMRSILLQMCRQLHKAMWIMKNQGIWLHLRNNFNLQ